uniref:Uncharacterized protein n=1 Tax=Salix viminalis TaxID=40686 RepID=A0A6N2KZJ0_SALVM
MQFTGNNQHIKDAVHQSGLPNRSLELLWVSIVSSLNPLSAEFDSNAGQNKWVFLDEMRRGVVLWEV